MLASVCEAPPYAPPFVVGLFLFNGVSGFVPYYSASNPRFRGNTSSASAALLGRTKKAFIISCRHRIMWRANIAVMPPAKMKIQHHSQQDIGNPSLNPWLLMHHLIAVIDANRAGDNPNTHKQTCSQMPRQADIKQNTKDRNKLNRRPQKRG